MARPRQLLGPRMHGSGNTNLSPAPPNPIDLPTTRGPSVALVHHHDPARTWIWGHDHGHHALGREAMPAFPPAPSSSAQARRADCQPPGTLRCEGHQVRTPPGHPTLLLHRARRDSYHESGAPRRRPRYEADHTSLQPTWQTRVAAHDAVRSVSRVSRDNPTVRFSCRVPSE